MESNESLEKLMKADLIELLDAAREKALKPPEANIAAQLDKVGGKLFVTPPIKAQDMPFEKLSKLDLVDLLRVARATPYYRLPKSELMRVPNSDLVDLLREAETEFLKRYSAPDYRSRVSRYVEGEKSHRGHEAKLQEDNQVYKPEDMPPTMPSETELELKGPKKVLEKTKLESDNRLDKVEGQLKTKKTDLVQGGCVDYGNAAAESNISTGSSTESSNVADSNSQSDKEDDPLKRARCLAGLATYNTIIKTRDLYYLLIRLELGIGQDKIFGIQHFDGLKIKAQEVCRELDGLISRAQEEVSLLSG